MNSTISFIAILIAIVSNVYSQAPQFCGTSELYNKLVKDNPAILIKRQSLEQNIKSYIKSKPSQKTLAQTYTLPIVFHILHNYGTENISDAQVYDQVSILNRDFRKLNADTINIAAEFKPLAADCEIEFRLAQKDAYGNCTNGIERIATKETYKGDYNSQLVIDANQWPSSKYLNVWVVAEIHIGVSAAGYAYYPGSTDNLHEGIVIINSFVGSIGTSTPFKSRVLTHEVGHYLNLPHVWGHDQVGVTCGDDGVADTPITKGWQSCPTNASATKICDTSIAENYQNYMEYSYCDIMFTKGQALHMQATLNSTIADRNNLWQVANLTSTGVNNAPVLCMADFTTSATSVCENGSVTFSDVSWNGISTIWNWSFPGASPSNGTTPSVVVTYPTAGQYNVSLTVSNGTGSVSITKTSLINVNANQAKYAIPFTEGFESVGGFPNSDWMVVNPDNSYSWTISNSAAFSGSKSVWVDNYFNDSARVDELIGPSFDLTGMASPKLFYKIAYAQIDAQSNDRLKVMVSTNCGISWAARQIKSGIKLKSVEPETSAFVPVSNGQWRPDSVSLLPYSSSKNLLIKFQFANVSGNNIYIDDINVKGTGLTSISNEWEDNINFSIYPNPIHDRSMISFNLINKANVSVNLIDILGKEVCNVLSTQQLHAGEYNYPFNNIGMEQGIYLVKLVVDDKLFVQKLIVH